MNEASMISLINQGTTKIFTASGEETVSWTLTKYKSSFMPFTFYSCEMKGLGTSAFGFGTDWSSDIAAQKSFCEAWERIWALKLGTTSNGFAAAPTLITAQDNSKFEKLERAILLEAWSEQKGWEKSKNSSSKNIALIFCLKLMGWRTDFYNVHSNAGILRVCLLRHSANGAIFDSAFATQATSVDEKLMLSVLKNVFLPRAEPIVSLPERGNPSDHRRFYSEPKNLAAFNFLDELSTSTVEVINLEAPEQLKTETVFEPDALPAVCVTTHPTWRSLSWGSNSISGRNPWPHPLN